MADQTKKEESGWSVDGGVWTWVPEGVTRPERYEVALYVLRHFEEWGRANTAGVYADAEEVVWGFGRDVPGSLFRHTSCSYTRHTSVEGDTVWVLSEPVGIYVLCGLPTVADVQWRMYLEGEVFDD